jgi:hypothetical protein
MRYYYLLLILAGFGLFSLTAPLSEGLSLFSEPVIAQTTTPAAPQPIFQPLLSKLTRPTTADRLNRFPASEFGVTRILKVTEPLQQGKMSV